MAKKSKKEPTYYLFWSRNIIGQKRGKITWLVAKRKFSSDEEAILFATKFWQSLKEYPHTTRVVLSKQNKGRIMTFIK